MLITCYLRGRAKVQARPPQQQGESHIFKTMKEIRFFYVPEARQVQELPAEEATHALRVLRMKTGDKMCLMDGKGTFYQALVGLTTNKKCFYQIQEVLPQGKTWNGRIHLAIAPTKMMDRMEWLVEKVTEVGFDEITFLNCKFSERQQIRTDRVEKIIVSAMKQSRKAWKPIVNGMTDFKTFVSEERKGKQYIAHCYPEIPRTDLFEELGRLNPEENVTILVGPEGDFSMEELKLAETCGYHSISLGNSRLRTETAGLMAVTMAQIIKRR